MSDYKFPCPNCSQSITAQNEQVGQMVQCPACKQMCTIPRPAVSSLPPIIPVQERTTGPATDPPLGRVGGAGQSTIPITSELERQVLDGGRFVVFQYCISVLVMTFRRPSQVMFLRADETAYGTALGYSLVSLVAGWWGIPWGPIWTVTSIVENLAGGKDLTHAVLAEKVGPARAAQIMAARASQNIPTRRRAPTAGTAKALWWSLGGAVSIFAIAMLLTVGAHKIGKLRHWQPGEAKFNAANQQLDMYRGRIGLGNSPQAIAVAERFSSNMKRLREEKFGGGKPDGFSLSHHEFLTWCELSDQKCALIVHVPELRRFTDPAKGSLADLAWMTAQIAVKSEHAGKPGMKLAVALRGTAVYDRVLLGSYDTDGLGTANQPSEVISPPNAEQALFPWFEPVQPAAVAGQQEVK